MGITFIRATTKEEREAINLFLTRHNKRGPGSKTGYVAYYAAVNEQDGRPLIDRIVAAAKICPLHTPQAARFFAGDDWRHVYCLQRLAAYRAPENLLSQFLGWVLRECGKDPRIHFVATYADAGTFDDRDGRPHTGRIYRITNGVYCGMSGGGVEGYIVNGERHSMRQGPKTMTLTALRAMENVQVIRSPGMHRYCWAVGTPLAKAFRRRTLVRRMSSHVYIEAHQPRLLARLRGLFLRFGKLASQEN